ncbi:hypothetical protein L6164_013019 [Bauhinia variegata]|uniref:Uncharacterized protein n=1 Tax=Bauhinia variegata TaxID=167791 RepID=A0ACB9PDC8_BAUVA|nr:hypothetical protein L6164_013019 [Bauhinia variegata]
MGNLIIVFLILLSISYTFAAIVSKDGSEDYTTIAEAIAQAPTFSAKPYIILVRAGIYEEYLIVPYEKTNIRLTGDGVKCTRIVGYRSTSGSLIPVNQSATIGTLFPIYCNCTIIRGKKILQFVSEGMDLSNNSYDCDDSPVDINWDLLNGRVEIKHLTPLMGLGMAPESTQARPQTPRMDFIQLTPAPR